MTEASFTAVPDDETKRAWPYSGNRYEVVITATGVVYDAEGNVVSEQPIKAVAILTEDEVRVLTQGDQV